MIFEIKEKNVFISAEEIVIGEDVSFGNNISIKVKGNFTLGSYSRLGNDVTIRGNNISFGEHFFNSSGLVVGGGGSQHPNANLSVGNRCTIHNSFINVCEPIVIGDDVGFSNDTSILTHGSWLSVLDGFPVTFKGVKIGNCVQIGYKSLVMMGVKIGDNIVIGANSVVTRNITKKGIYAGFPAIFINDILPLSFDERVIKTKEIISEYLKIAEYHSINPNIKLDYPHIYFKDFEINVENCEYKGKEDEETDDFRDYIRKWGIRIYTKRPFICKFTF